MRHFRLLFICVLLSIPVLAQSRIDCNVLESHILHETIHYCVLLPAQYDGKSSQRYSVLYFLHGLGGNEQALFKMGGWDLVQDMRREHKISDFLIVTPEARNSFYVNSSDGKALYSDFFLQEFMPFIEHKYHTRHDRGGRAVSGISMGGYGALRFAFAYPKLFSAVSAESAALITDTPKELNTMFRSGSPLADVLASAFGNPIDIRHWRENDPFVLARKNRDALQHVAIYFNCGRDDQFEFEVGAEKLHTELDSEGIKHEYHLYPGDHSAQYFLAHLAELMEFHSRIFAIAK